jgi:hypothetical protein
MRQDLVYRGKITADELKVKSRVKLTLQNSDNGY